MLEPDTRELLLDVLRPPDGWQLGHAMGTTFTLDLQALLIAPLAFALFDWAVDEKGRADPLAMLEALRRNAERTTLFCQAGMIGLPADYQPLLIHLEPCVVPVTPPNSNGIFHPKVWLLQFTRDGEDPRYRLICLSRNLTFDTSWDTVVALEGTRRLKRRHSEDVGRFVRGVVDLGGTRLAPARREALLAIADDVVNIRFDRPDGFNNVRFHSLGFDGPSWPFRENPDRALVISPFLGADTLTRLTASGDGHVLVSRPESLDELGQDGVTGFDRVTVLSGDVMEDHDATAEDADTPSEASSEGAISTLRGLHAKVFAFETGDRLRLFTGSANATAAAFASNVEFLVELGAPTSSTSIARFLEGPAGVTAFGDLLEDYTPSEEQEPPPPSRELSNLLEHTRRAIGALNFRALVEPVEELDDEFLLELQADGPLRLPDEIREVHCWRITAGQGHLVSPRIDRDGLHAAFGRVAYEGITSFFAFELAADLGGRTDRVRFVVNAELVGAPTDRAETVIARLLKSRDDLIRYLLFLLADSDAGMAALLEAFGGEAFRGDGRPRSLFDQPALMETLLRALVRDPDRIDHVGRVLGDLDEAGRLDELTPPGLTELWEAIGPVRAELAGRASP